jgi:hypothetical protein
MATKQDPVTKPTEVDVEAFLDSVVDETRRRDAGQLLALLHEVTGEQPVMWGPSIVGFGSFHYRYESGREGDSPLAAFSPRKQHLVVYLVPEFETRHASTLARLGPHKTGKSCLYIRRLADVDLGALRELVERSARVARGIDRTSGAT